MKTCFRALIICALLGSQLFTACAYRSGEDNIVPGGCNTPATVSYLNDVLPVLQSSCLGCHDAAGNAGGIVFDTYNGLKTIVDNGSFQGAINHDAGWEPMPRNASKLPDCTLESIQAWIDDGAPEN
ncbi:MAG: hypothetical protein R8P61_20290 [Bacteroidia bacterium]|nr:hypothetical protein [Bacteroidia bacterium]